MCLTWQVWCGRCCIIVIGIRPQDNPDAALYPEIAKHIEDILNSTGKKVVIRGCSGGTINGYAFLMSQVRLDVHLYGTFVHS